jgi:hypothetical protein
MPVLSLSGEHPLDCLGLGGIPDLLPAQVIDDVAEEIACSITDVVHQFHPYASQRVLALVAVAEAAIAAW